LKEMKGKPNYIPFLWSTAIFLICFGLMFLAVAREEIFIQSHQISVPSISGAANGVPGGAGIGNVADAITVNSAGIPVLYFFVMAALLGVALYFIPVSKLWFLLRLLFGFGFSWGVFIFFGFFLPVVLAIVLAVVGGLAWFLVPRVWLHNGLLILVLVSLGAVFGAMFSPWTVILVMLVIAIYDFLAVKFGYMQWMARKLSDAETLPAFFIPYKIANVRLKVNGSFVKDIFDDKGERQFSILGGGDIFFPLWLSATVWFASDASMTLVVGAFSLLGIICTYLIHYYWMAGRATPALPAIFVSSLCGLLLVRFVLLV
jgi:presenilin-like A22 family membrane protease